MAAPQPGVWGIDLGQCGAKALRLEMIEGELTATAFDYIEYPKILTQPDADPDQLTHEALEQFLSRNSIRGDMVVISVPGQSGLARFVKLPPVEERKIADIVRFEAKQQIPFPLDEVVWDFQKLGAGEVSDGFAMGTEIGLFALKRDMVFRYLQHFKDVNVEVHVVQMAPLALCNFISFDLIAKDRENEEEEPAAKSDKKQCVVALDIGTDNSNLVITDGDRIIWQRPIPLGGNHFTRALTKDMKLTFAKAEHLKRNAARSPELKKILSSLKPVLNDFAAEVQRSLGYFTNTHRDAEVQYMIGLGNAFRLPGLQKFLQEKLQLEVRKFTKMERVQGEEVMSAPTFVENLSTFALAYGLALQGLGKTRLTTNLLPYDVKLERLVRSKKPWAITAAACLVLAVAGYTFAKSMERAQVTGSEINNVFEYEKEMLAKKGEWETEHKKEWDKLEESKKAMSRLAAGVDERWNWQLLNLYLNYALPSPDGKRVPEETRKNFPARKEYVTKEAKEAFDALEEKRFADKSDTKLPDPDPDELKKSDLKIKKNLIQVNIEAVTPRFYHDLTVYYKAIKPNPGVEVKAMKPDEKEKLDAALAVIESAPGKFAEFAQKNDMPTSGWVVEVRGYSYHRDGWSFIENTFLENLNPEYVRKGVIAKVGDKIAKDSDEIRVEISPEAAEVLRKDDVFDLYRPNPIQINRQFLGTVKIIEVGNNVIVGQHKPNSRKTPVQAGDVVGDCFVQGIKKDFLDKPYLHVDDKTEVSLNEILYERVKTRISFLFIYKTETVQEPRKGVFELIGATQFDFGLRGGGAGKGPAEVKDRAKWEPLGISSLNQRTATAESIGTPREEFVMLFIWQEPFLAPAKR